MPKSVYFSSLGLSPFTNLLFVHFSQFWGECIQISSNLGVVESIFSLIFFFGESTLSHPFQPILGGVYFIKFGAIFSLFFLNWGGLDIFPQKLPYLGGGSGNKSKFLGELDENVMRKFSCWGGVEPLSSK